MMLCRFRKLLFLFAICCCTGHLAGQSPGISRIWAVKDGLPQSYVSGLFQDKDGFLWISTLNGFCRCDGRTFRYFRHNYNDTKGLSGNIILHMLDVGDNQLMLCYMDGRIELFNTVTEKVIPLWKEKTFEDLRVENIFFKSIIHVRHGICYMMARDGGIVRLDLNRHLLTRLSVSGLQLPGPVLGLASRQDTLLLFTRTGLSARDSSLREIRRINYPFGGLALYSTGEANVYSTALRENGDIILTDSVGMKIWNPATGIYSLTPLIRKYRRGRLIARFDQNGNYYFECDGGIYLLRPDNTLQKWSQHDPGVKGIITTMYIDRSGVLWAGTNGYGLRQYNLLKTGVQGYYNRQSFVIDVLDHYSAAPSSARRVHTMLDLSVPFADRCASSNDSVWVADINQQSANPKLVLYANHTISEQTFHNEDELHKNELHRIIFLTFTSSGVLWGIDQHFSLVRFDIQHRRFRVLHSFDLSPGEELNGMAADGESSFYITTTRNLIRTDTLGRTERLTALLPSKELVTVSTDRYDNNIVWIGTLSDGLIRLDIRSRQTNLFSMATGLPNNTIYSIMEGNDRQLWCSSNKGIFAFNRQLHTVLSFTSRDGLVDDEFNRFYYMALPDGDLAFGGPMGYTIFNPLKLKTDDFDPPIALTGLEIINWRRQDSSLKTLSELRLRHDQNFITVEFAAMQFDFPDKLQYRYMLEGVDKNWILTGSDNKAYYTSLPPGNYTLLLNASNTAGKWSSHIRRIHIMIAAPFWTRWWFYTASALLAGMLIYLFIWLRIKNLKRAHTQQLQFERKAMELQAMALRARMNPHFIFNCLNSIKALIQEKEDKKAVTYLTSFVTLIRKQLSNATNKTTLQEELETCRLYLQLEAMRFDGRIAYEFDIDADVCAGQVTIPPLILQPIVENAVVHGLIPLEEGGLVRVRVYRDDRFVICSIEDNGIGRAASAEHRRSSSRLHESKGVEMLEQRIMIQHRLNEWYGTMETVDMYGSGEEPAGTRVTLRFDAKL